MRLFVAIELSVEVRRVLARVQLSLTAFDGPVRWVDTTRMHLTLKFLGETPDHRVPEVIGGLEAAARNSCRFTLRTAGAGCFPPAGKVRVVWVGLAADAGLVTCQEQVASALADRGFPEDDRSFAPHLTLGRVKDDRTGGALRSAVAAVKPPAVEQDVGSIVLMQSELGHGGAQYTRLGVWPLG